MNRDQNPSSSRKETPAPVRVSLEAIREAALREWTHSGIVESKAENGGRVVVSAEEFEANNRLAETGLWVGARRLGLPTISFEHDAVPPEIAQQTLGKKMELPLFITLESERYLVVDLQVSAPLNKLLALKLQQLTGPVRDGYRFEEGVTIPIDARILQVVLLSVDNLDLNSPKGR